MNDGLKEGIVRKIRKLLRLSESPNLHEAESAARAASDLMQKYQIDRSSILLKEYEKDEIVKQWVMRDESGSSYNFIYILARAACRLFDGEAVLGGHRPLTFAFVGFKSDIPLMIAAFNHFYGSWSSIVEFDLAEAKDHSEADFTAADTLRFKSSHSKAFSSVILSRCVELQLKRRSAVLASGSTGRSLMLLKDKAVEDFGKKDGWKIRKSRQVAFSDKKGYVMGVAAGRQLPLGGGIGGPSQSSPRLPSK